MGFMFLLFVPQTISTKYGYALPAVFLRACVFVLAITSGAIPVQASQSQSFVFAADSQGGSFANQVNTSVLTSIVNNILAMSPAPKVVIFGGDTTFTGGTANLTSFKSLFTDRLTAAGIPSAYVIGNHEPYAPPTYNQPLTGQQQFQALFNNNWIQNGPAGFNNLAFSFQVGNSLFIIADSFYVPPQGAPTFGINQAQQDWIKGLLQNNTAPHTFVFTHVPAYSPSIPSANPDNQYTWQTITTSGSATNTNASILFTGHEHLYYRTLHDGTYEVISGSAGAPLGCENPGETCGPVSPGDVFAMQYSYTVVTTEGREVTVNVFNPTNQILDSFHFFDNSGVNNALINNTSAIAPNPLDLQPSGILAGSGNTITNNAAISNVATGIDAVSHNTITNSGTITPLSGGNGIHVYDNNTITNTVSGSITGNSSDLWGIWVNTGNTVVNNGAIAVSGTNSVAFLARGDNNTLTNTGTLSAFGTDSYAVKFMGTENTFVNSGAISGNIWFDAGNNTFTNSGILDGSGGLYKAGAGTLTLRGPTSYTGGTYLNGGIINISQDTSLGALSGGLFFNGGTLQLSADMTSPRNVTLKYGGGTFDTKGNALTLSGAISGPGSLTKAGAGTLELTGANDSAGGGTLVQSGTLSVNGTLQSQVDVNAGAVLSGTGRILGPVNLNGTLAPGNSVGTLQVTGNLTVAPGAIYQAQVDTNSADLIRVGGTATLSGGTVVASVGNNPVLGRLNRILSAGGGVLGTFANVTYGDLAFILPSLIYDSNDVFLTLARNGTVFASVAQTPNQVATANAIGAGPVGNDLDLALLGQSASGARKAFDALSGEIYASTQTVMLADSLYLRESVLGRMRQASFGGAIGPMAAFASGGPTLAFVDESRISLFPFKNSRLSDAGVHQPDTTFWTQGAGAWGSSDSDGNAAEVNRTLAGFFCGVDRRTVSNLLAGFAGGYTNSSLDISDRASSTNINTAHLAGYVGVNNGPWNLRTAATASFSGLETSRSIVFPGFVGTANADNKAITSQIFGELGYGVAFGQVAAEPFARLAFVHLNTENFTETAGTGFRGGVLRGSGSSDDIGYSTLGGRVATSFTLPRDTVLTLRVSAAWEHAFDSITPTTALAFQNTGSSFTTAGVPLARDSALIESGLEMQLNPQTKFGLSFSSQFGCNVQDNAVQGNLTWRF
jgi:outer membrane autotransporter protein